MSKSAKKNAKRKEKRDEKKVDVPDSWEDEEEVHDNAIAPNANSPTKDIGSSSKLVSSSQIEGNTSKTHDSASATAASTNQAGPVEELASKMEKVVVS